MKYDVNIQSKLFSLKAKIRRHYSFLFNIFSQNSYSIETQKPIICPIETDDSSSSPPLLLDFFDIGSLISLFTSSNINPIVEQRSFTHYLVLCSTPARA